MNAYTNIPRRIIFKEWTNEKRLLSVLANYIGCLSGGIQIVSRIKQECQSVRHSIRNRLCHFPIPWKRKFSRSVGLLLRELTVRLIQIKPFASRLYGALFTVIFICEWAWRCLEARFYEVRYQRKNFESNYGLYHKILINSRSFSSSFLKSDTIGRVIFYKPPSRHIFVSLSSLTSLTLTVSSPIIN